MDKKSARLRRARRTRAMIKKLGAVRLCVHKTPQHIYAQIIASNGSEVLASASTLDKEIKQTTGYGGNVSAAIVVGKAIAERAKSAGVTDVAFDRSGFKYHGRVKALADAAREVGLNF
ncbi:MAG: 50S ribosomal protein L18 [Candidatus Parabeggiatoa sp. nov. 3]|nr:MAG: 50S ribosomal protein L18 [Gammaproteobacteria bacterium]RKZ69409.1 MAG: 50S ribosomal protein L18 [Gammaproteobacteria bacterium]RKZ90243.1 MAG: 50S ribosomal protein L18 [Gammaproteobacteria bacterium]